MTSDISESHNNIIDTWREETSADSAYYSRFEAPELMSWFWGIRTPFRVAFERYLDLTDVLEIASGAGRHSAQIVEKCGRLTLIDTSILGTKLAKERFSDAENVEVLLSIDGKSLPFDQERFSAVFSYDAMVHFEPLTVAEYVGAIASVLKPGGRALLHHSNYAKHPTNHFKDNPDWRNFMPHGFIEHIASRSGLKLIDRKTFSWKKKWGFRDKTDALTVFEKN
jgi:SAM-dependent methyltransferase